MKNGQCPMCKSTEVYANSTLYFQAGEHYVDLGEETTFTPYICLDCGFTAMYVEDMKDIKSILETKGWKKIN